MPDQPPPPADPPVVIDANAPARPDPPVRGVESTAEVDIRDFLVTQADPPKAEPNPASPKKR
jgi:hypothetical protein